MRAMDSVRRGRARAGISVVALALVSSFSHPVTLEVAAPDTSCDKVDGPWLELGLGLGIGLELSVE